MTVTAIILVGVLVMALAVGLISRSAMTNGKGLSKDFKQIGGK